MVFTIDAESKQVHFFRDCTLKQIQNISSKPIKQNQFQVSYGQNMVEIMVKKALIHIYTASKSQPDIPKYFFKFDQNKIKEINSKLGEESQGGWIGKLGYNGTGNSVNLLVFLQLENAN